MHFSSMSNPVIKIISCLYHSRTPYSEPIITATKIINSRHRWPQWTKHNPCPFKIFLLGENYKSSPTYILGFWTSQIAQTWTLWEGTVILIAISKLAIFRPTIDSPPIKQKTQIIKQHNQNTFPVPIQSKKNVLPQPHWKWLFFYIIENPTIHIILKTKIFNFYKTQKKWNTNLNRKSLDPPSEGSGKRVFDIPNLLGKKRREKPITIFAHYDTTASQALTFPRCFRFCFSCCHCHWLWGYWTSPHKTHSVFVVAKKKKGKAQKDIIMKENGYMKYQRPRMGSALERERYWRAQKQVSILLYVSLWSEAILTPHHNNAVPKCDVLRSFNWVFFIFYFCPNYIILYYCILYWLLSIRLELDKRNGFVFLFLFYGAWIEKNCLGIFMQQKQRSRVA